VRESASVSHSSAENRADEVTMVRVSRPKKGERLIASATLAVGLLTP
jgi:hypothetical protein